MLPYKNRLIKRKDFESVYRKGSSFSSKHVVLKVAESGSQETRVGFSVGLKFSKRAVERNRIKRQMREIVRPKVAQFKKGFDVIVLPRKRKDEKIDPRALRSNLEEVLQKSGLISN